MTEINTSYASSTFINLSNEKKTNIISCALKVFAENGYDMANVNVIAQNAGISIGSLYKYFISKEQLYLAVVDSGVSILCEVLKVDEQSRDIFEFYSGMLSSAWSFACSYPEYNQLYLDITSRCPADAALLSSRIESITVKSYKRQIEMSKKKGIIRTDLQDGYIAWMLDSLLMMLQFSSVSKYYRERLIAFTGAKSGESYVELISSIEDFIAKALQP